MKMFKICFYVALSIVNIFVINTTYASSNRSFDYFNIKINESGSSNSTHYYNYTVTFPTDEVIQGDAQGTINTSTPVSIGISTPGITSGNVTAVITITDPNAHDRIVLKGTATYSDKDKMSLSTNQMYSDGKSGISGLKSSQPGKDAPFIQISLIG